MKFSIRFLSVLCALCFTLCTEQFARADSPIGGPGPAFENSAGLSGNRTAFSGNTGALNNNQWNNLMNQNPIGQQAATVDFGKCNALVLRCAQPKCSGCTTMELAIPIVNGCVQSNPSCKQHGDALIQTLAAQIVSNKTAKANEAAAAAAAQNTNSQSNAQIEQMQQQMTQMQQQMQEQSAQSAAAVQQALEEQKKLAADQAAAAAAAATTPDAAVSNAAAAGVSADVLAREQIGGQILTKVENAEVAMKDLKNTMQNIFDYAGCDVNGNNCTGPKRVKAFKNKANQFFDPYEAVLDELYDALILAQSLGVDITDIYMMLNGSCNVWGKYMCEPCDPDATDKSKDYGHICTNGTRKTDKDTGKEIKTGFFYDVKKDYAADGSYKVSSKQAHCTLLNMLANQEEVQQNWLDMDAGSSGGIRVACASDAIDNSKLFKNRKKQATIDIETLQRIINQDAPNIISNVNSANDAIEFCRAENSKDILANMVQRKKLPNRNLCVTKEKMNTEIKISEKETTSDNGCGEDNDNDYINQVVALCSTHAYNIGQTTNPTNATDKQNMNDVVALKTTIMTQQMKKQYDFLDVTVKRLKTQLEKSILTAKVQAAGGNATDDSNGNSSKSDDKSVFIAGVQNCLTQSGATQETLKCVQRNIGLIRNESSMSNVRKQLVNELNTYKIYATEDAYNKLTDEKGACKDASGIMKSDLTTCLNTFNASIGRFLDEYERGGSNKSRNFQD